MLGKYEIVKWPAKVLETKANDVDDFSDELRLIVKEMHLLIEKTRGIGLAANQIGVLKRVLTINIPYTDEDQKNEQSKEWWHDKAFTFINPVITLRSNDKIRAYEGCLSFPEVFDYVPRHSKVTVKAYDELGKEFQVEADGLFAICLQHEIGHLDGIVFVRRMSRLKFNMIKKKMFRKQAIEQIA